MGQNLPPFANAEDVMQALLADVGPPVLKATNVASEPPFIVVLRIGGHSDYVTDFPELMVTAVGATRAASSDLARQCQAAVENSFNTSVTLTDGTVVLIDGSMTMTSGHPEPYENIDWREEPAMYSLRLRRPRTYSGV